MIEGNEYLEIKEELIRRIETDPINYLKKNKGESFNPAQRKAITIISKGDPVNILTFGNGTGKTFTLMAIWSAIMFGTKNPLFQNGIYKEWKYPKNARLCAPEGVLGDDGPIQEGINKLFPKGKYEQYKNRKNYFSSGVTETGWKWDVMTYDQMSLQAAGVTKGLILYSEPPPYNLFKENIGRLRAGGIIICEMTPLDMCAWIKDEYIDEGELKNDKGEIIGKINHIEGEIWDNCDENPGGQLPRQSIEIMISQWDSDEREMRVSGKFSHVGGRVYKKFNKDIHVIDKPHDFHLEEMKRKNFDLWNVIDPHDRKPFAIGWYAVFQNGDVYCIAEFPDDTYLPFHKIKDFSYIAKDYAKLIKATEESIGKVSCKRLIDPNFGNSPSFATNTTIKQELYKAGQEIGFNLTYHDANDNIEIGHMLVKDYLGDPQNNIRPKFYIFSHCKNHIYGMSYYGWKESKSKEKPLSEKTELQYKDFPDLVRYALIAKPSKIKLTDNRINLYNPKDYYGSNYRGF